MKFLEFIMAVRKKIDNPFDIPLLFLNDRFSGFKFSFFSIGYHV